MKTMATARSKEEAKYLRLIDDALLEFKEIQKELRREQVKMARLRAASRRTMNQISDVIRPAN